MTVRLDIRKFIFKEHKCQHLLKKKRESAHEKQETNQVLFLTDFHCF